MSIKILSQLFEFCLVYTRDVLSCDKLLRQNLGLNCGQSEAILLLVFPSRSTKGAGLWLLEMD